MMQAKRTNHADRKKKIKYVLTANRVKSALLLDYFPQKMKLIYFLFQYITRDRVTYVGTVPNKNISPVGSSRSGFAVRLAELYDNSNFLPEMLEMQSNVSLPDQNSIIPFVLLSNHYSHTPYHILAFQNDVVGI